MGYDISARLSNKEETMRMISFLNENAHIFRDLEKNANLFPNSFMFFTGDDVGVYAPQSIKNNLVNLHCSTTGEAIFSIIFWIAQKSTYRKCGLPVYYYDDEISYIATANSQEERSAILKQSNKSNKPTSIVNQHGRIMNHEHTIMETLGRALLGADKQLQQTNIALDILDVAWTEFTKTNPPPTSTRKPNGKK